MNEFNNTVHIVHIDGYFGQGHFPWNSLDIKLLSEEFSNKNFKVELLDIRNIAVSTLTKNDLVLISSSQREGVKQYVDDICLILSERGCDLIPNYRYIRAHENKGLQALIKNELGLNTLDEKYLTTEYVDFSQDSVYKMIDGAGSHGVFLAKNKNNFFRKLNNVDLLNSKLSNIFSMSKLYFKKYFLFGWRVSDDMIKYYRNTTPLLVQNLVPNLTCDFKVIVFGRKYFILKRGVRPNDFRASGSALFELVDEPNVEVLNCAMNFSSKLDVPYVSLDIVLGENGSHVIEFQCTHFGPYTVESASHYFFYDDENWKAKCWSFQSIEKAYVDSIIEYLGVS